MGDLVLKPCGDAARWQQACVCTREGFENLILQEIAELLVNIIINPVNIIINAERSAGALWCVCFCSNSW